MRLWLLILLVAQVESVIRVGNCTLCNYPGTELHLALADATPQNNTIELYGEIVVTESDERSPTNVFTLELAGLSIIGQDARITSEDMSFHNYTLFAVAASDITLESFAIGNSFASDKALIRLGYGNASSSSSINNTLLQGLEFSDHSSNARKVVFSSNYSFSNVSILGSRFRAPENAGSFQQAIAFEALARVDGIITIRDNEFYDIGMDFDDEMYTFANQSSIVDARRNFWCPCPYSEEVERFVANETLANYPLPPAFEFNLTFAQNPYDSESLDRVLWLPYDALPFLDEESDRLPGPLHDEHGVGATSIGEILQRNNSQSAFISASHYLALEPALVVDRALTITQSDGGCLGYCATAPTLHVSSGFFQVDLPAFVGIECLLSISALRITLHSASELAWYRGADEVPAQLVQEIAFEGSVSLTDLAASDIPSRVTRAYSVLSPSTYECSLLTHNFIQTRSAASYTAALVSEFSPNTRAPAKFSSNTFLGMSRFALRLVDVLSTRGVLVLSNLFSSISGPAVQVDRWATQRITIAENTFHSDTLAVQFDNSGDSAHDSQISCNACLETTPECYRVAKSKNSNSLICSNCEQSAFASEPILNASALTCGTLDTLSDNALRAILESICASAGIDDSLLLAEFAQHSNTRWVALFCNASTALAFENQCISSSPSSKSASPSIEHNTFVIEKTTPAQPVSGDAAATFDRYKNVFVWLAPGDNVSFLEPCAPPNASIEFNALGYGVELFTQSASVRFVPRAVQGQECDAYGAEQYKAFLFGTFLPMHSYCVDASCVNRSGYGAQPVEVFRAFGNVSKQCIDAELEIKHALDDQDSNETCAWFSIAGGIKDKSTRYALLDVNNQSIFARDSSPLCFHTANISLEHYLGPYSPYALCKRERINRCVFCNNASLPERSGDKPGTLAHTYEAFECDQAFSSIADALETIFYHGNTGAEPETIYVFGNCTECDIQVPASVTIVDGARFVTSASVAPGGVLATPECCSIFNLGTAVDFFRLENLTLASSNSEGCDHSGCSSEFCAIKSSTCALENPVQRIALVSNTFQRLACGVVVDQAVQHLLVLNNSFLEIGNTSIVRNTSDCPSPGDALLSCSPPDTFFPPSANDSHYQQQPPNQEPEVPETSPLCNLSSVAPRTEILYNLFWSVDTAIDIGPVPRACESEEFSRQNISIANNTLEFHTLGIVLNRVQSANSTFSAQLAIEMILNGSTRQLSSGVDLVDNSLEAITPLSADTCPDQAVAAPVGLSLYANHVLDLRNRYESLRNFHYGSHYLVLNSSYHNVTQTYGQYHISFGTPCAGVFAQNIDRAMVNSSFDDSELSRVQQYSLEPESVFSSRAAQRNARQPAGQEALWLENVTLEAAQLRAPKYLDVDKGVYYTSVMVVNGSSRTSGIVAGNEALYNTSSPLDLDANEYFDAQARVRQCGDVDPESMPGGSNDTQVVLKQQCVDLANHEYLSEDNSTVLRCENNEFYDRDNGCCKVLTLSSFQDDISKTRTKSSGSGAPSPAIYVVTILIALLIAGCCLCCCLRRSAPQRTVIENVDLSANQLPPGEGLSQPIGGTPMASDGYNPPESVYPPTNTGGGGGYQGPTTAYTYGDQYASTAGATVRKRAKSKERKHDEL